MSSNTWTPPAVDSEARRATRRLWRAVEAQHIASTLRLVANVEEQLVLERILDQSKPALPKDVGLGKLLAPGSSRRLTACATPMQMTIETAPRRPKKKVVQRTGHM